MINKHFQNLKQNYLFSTIAHRVQAFREAHPERNVISLGIGDVTRPLPPASIAAMHRAVDEMAVAETFRGYGPEQGYAFLRQAIVDHDYTARGVQIDIDEIFISDGAKSDCGNITDILDTRLSVAVTDPVYPVYVDSNIMAGRPAGGSIRLLPVTAEGHFVPALPAEHIDLIYLCYPNNPTGTVLRRDQLQEWVDYALREGSLILFDSAYEAFIQHDDIPHSIYEIPGAKRCAIELRSFSKTAGFTGVRCGYTVVPRELQFDGVCLRDLWNRRQCTKFNGTSYITQRAAEAIYTPEGQQQVRATIQYYMEGARMMRERLTQMGYQVVGGTDAPYIWLTTPSGIDSWTFFDRLLNEAALVTTPGVGFGPSGEGYVRLTAFGSHENCAEALQRIAALG